MTIVINQCDLEAIQNQVPNLIASGTLFRRIILQVHSSLDAVGLTAAVSSKLTERGISANVIAAFYHDHIFIPAERAHEAVEALRELVGGSVST
jgi:uncharacterized protein